MSNRPRIKQHPRNPDSHSTHQYTHTSTHVRVSGTAVCLRYGCGGMRGHGRHPGLSPSKYDKLVLSTQQHGVARSSASPSCSRTMATAQANIRLACEDDASQGHIERLIWYKHKHDGTAKDSPGEPPQNTQLWPVSVSILWRQDSHDRASAHSWSTGRFTVPVVISHRRDAGCPTRDSTFVIRPVGSRWYIADSRIN